MSRTSTPSSAAAFSRATPNVVLGEPGTGKTTLSLRFALEGARRGEPVLFVTASQTAEDLRQVARSHGWSLDGVEVEEIGGRPAVPGGR